MMMIGSNFRIFFIWKYNIQTLSRVLRLSSSISQLLSRFFSIILFIHLLCLAAKRNANFHNYHRKNLMWFPHFVSGTKANELPKNNNNNKLFCLFANNSQVLKIFACAIYDIWIWNFHALEKKEKKVLIFYVGGGKKGTTFVASSSFAFPSQRNMKHITNSCRSNGNILPSSRVRGPFCRGSLYPNYGKTFWRTCIWRVCMKIKLTA